MFNTLISNFLLMFYFFSLVCAIPVDPSSTRRELVARTSGKPMAKTLYHGTSTRQCDAEKIGHSPSRMPTVHGDFPPVGGFYMFDLNAPFCFNTVQVIITFPKDHTEAWWGNMFRVTGTAKTFCVVELEYTESHEHKVYTFPLAKGCSSTLKIKKMQTYDLHEGQADATPPASMPTDIKLVSTKG
ncbi:hypothetical protein BT96DRAFT_999218 [Gymnopus androsaceus JB14]|uniref:Ubiquitin 3 binding protein But2 C-terminal domain-containing protein n=1 Tax=Gymnopus androsaceus JB14 TaxID=1447944 RepID=A0A6A4H7J6_9AGAR|nr:hypothetical protein BT96DRAFT_999218 [Gymnopus androsaceus JB14]